MERMESRERGVIYENEGERLLDIVCVSAVVSVLSKNG